MTQQFLCWAYTPRKPESKETRVPQCSLFMIARTWKQPRCPCRRMAKQVVVHINNGVSLTYKKEHIWVCSNEVDETGAYYTEWGKSEREKPIQYINAYIWNLERQEWWSYMQGNKRDTDVKNRLLDSVGEGESGMIWENSIGTCILPRVKQMTRENSMHEAGHSKPVHWDHPEGWGEEGRGRGFQDGGTCAPMGDSCWCVAKTTTIL